MGMYTGLRCKLIIKEEYREDMDTIVNKFDSTYGFRDNLKSELLKHFYFNIPRATSIPHGGVELCFPTWDEGDAYGFKNSFDINTGLLKFECSLKNYEETIEYFLNNILTEICEQSFHIEVLYETWDNSELYKIEDGVLYELEEKIQYGYF